MQVSILAIDLSNARDGSGYDEPEGLQARVFHLLSKSERFVSVAALKKPAVWVSRLKASKPRQSRSTLKGWRYRSRDVSVIPVLYAAISLSRRVPNRDRWFGLPEDPPHRCNHPGILKFHLFASKAERRASKVL